MYTSYTNYSLFDSLSRENWDLVSGKNSFDETNVKTYLDNLNEKDQAFVKELISKTNYITYDEFKRNLFLSFEKFKNSVSSDVLLNPNYNKINSQHWVSLLLWDQIKSTPNIKTLKYKNIYMDIKTTRKKIRFLYCYYMFIYIFMN